MATKDKRKRPKRATSPVKPFSREDAAKVVDLVNRFVDPLCEAEGMEMVHTEFLQGPGVQTLRLYIDKPGGVTLDDCAQISRQIGDYLDVALDEIGAYSLEVSSPGPERPVGRRSDFERFSGRMAKITTRQPLGGRKNFTGRLRGIVGETVNIQVDDNTVEIPFGEIQRARLVDGEN
jgi:ribosome maturation factor RimP